MKLSVKSGREDKIHIFIDSVYKLTVDAEYWYLSKYHTLKEIDEPTYEEMEREIEKRRAFKKGMALSSSRLHSQYELYRKLLKSFPKEYASYAAEKCAQIGLVNDRDYAELFANELLSRKGMGVSRIKLELKRKGIDSDIIQEVCQELDCDEKQQIKDLIDKKYFRRLTDEKGKRSVFNALIRLGYSYGDVKNSIEEYILENEL